MIAWGRVGVPIRIEAHYIKNGVGVDGLSVTMDYHDESLNWTTGVGLDPAGGVGHYYKEITPDAEGDWAGHTITAGDVDQKHLPFIIHVEAANATVGGIAAACVTALEALLATGVTTVGGFFTLLKAQLASIYTKVTASSTVISIVGPGPDDNGIITIIPGDAYGADHGNPIPFNIPNAGDLTDATLDFTVDGVTFAAPIVPTVTGVDENRIAWVELSAADTELMRAVLVPGIPQPGTQVYCRITAEWVADVPVEPQTIAQGEVRRPEWDTRT